MKETRSSILLIGIAEKLRKKTGDNRYRTRVDRPNIIKLIYIACTRPICMFAFYYLFNAKNENVPDLVFTEPVVAAFSVSIICPSFRLVSYFSFLISSGLGLPGELHSAWLSTSLFLAVDLQSLTLLLFTRSVAGVFQSLHHFNIGETGTAFIAIS